jgi:hypothetical protein
MEAMGAPTPTVAFPILIAFTNRAIYSVTRERIGNSPLRRITP